jgi:RNA recognition motif-containing protein
MILHVSNLDSNVQSADLMQLFGALGEVRSATIVSEQQSNYSPELGIVDMPNYREALYAIEQLNGFLLKNRHINVYRVKEK